MPLSPNKTMCDASVRNLAMAALQGNGLVAAGFRQVDNTTFAATFVDSSGAERIVTVKFATRKLREDDALASAILEEEVATYAAELEEKRIKAAEKEAEKRAKIARDEKAREKKRLELQAAHDEKMRKLQA